MFGLHLGIGRRISRWFKVSAPFLSDLSMSGGAATYTRSGTVNITDFEGQTRTVQANCAPFPGARTGTNLLANSKMSGSGAFPTGYTRPTGTGSSDVITGSSFSSVAQSATAQRPYIQRGVTLEVGKSYRLSMYVEEASGPITQPVMSMGGVTLSSGSFSTYVAAGFVGRLFSPIFTIGSLTTPLARFGLGASANDTGVLRFSRPMVHEVTGAIAAEYIQTETAVITASFATSKSSVPSLTCWGDSLTFANYPRDLTFMSAEVPAYYNRGVAGETSSQIKTRFLAEPARWGDVTIIWAGNNNWQDPETIKSDIQAMVANLTTSQYVVMTLLNGDYSDRIKGTQGYDNIVNNVNPWILATFPDNALDIRKFLVDSYDPTNPTDVIDHDIKDIHPSSLRSDSIHLTVPGYSLVARRAHEFISAKGWNSASAMNIENLKGVLLASGATLSLPWSGNFRANDISGQIKWKPLTANQGLIWLMGSYKDAQNYFGIRITVAGNIELVKCIGGVEYIASKPFAYAANTDYDIRYRVSSVTGLDIWVDGTKGLNDPDTSDIVAGTTIRLNDNGNGTNPGNAQYSCPSLCVWKDYPDERMTQTLFR